jgi:hypothetical protein
VVVLWQASFEQPRVAGYAFLRLVEAAGLLGIFHEKKIWMEAN